VLPTNTKYSEQLATEIIITKVRKLNVMFQKSKHDNWFVQKYDKVCLRKLYNAGTINIYVGDNDGDKINRYKIVYQYIYVVYCPIDRSSNYEYLTNNYQ